MWTTPSAEVQPLASPRPSGGLSLRLVFHTIRRHVLALLGVCILAGTVGACIWLFMPLPKKTAAVLFRIDSQPRGVYKPTEEFRLETYRQSQIALAKLRHTLNGALDDKKVQTLQMVNEAGPDQRLAWLEENVRVDSRGGPEYIRITVEGNNDQELLTLVGAVGGAYHDAAKDQEMGARLNHLEKLRKQLQQQKSELAALYRERQSLSDILKAPPEDLAKFREIRKRELDDAMDKHQDRRQQLVVAQEALESARRPSPSAIMAVTGAAWRGIPVKIPPGVLETALGRDPEFQKLEAAVSAARATVIKREEDYQPGAPNLVEAQDRLKAAEEAQDKYRDKFKKDKRAELSEELRKLEDEQSARGESAALAEAKQRLKTCEALTEYAWDEVKRIKDDLTKYGEYRTQIEDLLRDIEQRQGVVNDLELMIVRLGMEVSADPRVSKVGDPYLVTGLDGNRRLKFAILATVAAFGLGFAGLVFWEHRSRRVTHADEVSANLGARLIGTIPPLAPAALPGEHAHTDLIEAIDTTRIMLMHGGRIDGDARVLLVTSAVSGEGKTTLSGNLAISLTRAGFRTLLIDGDIHAPTAHELFQLPDGPGFGELLRQETDVAGAIRTVPIPGLSIMPAGSWTPATHQMLVGSRWRQLQRELKDQFDFVIIDTSPLLLVSDTMLLAREVDGVILSVLLGVSQTSRVAETISRLQAVGAKLAGVVVNNVRSAAAPHAYAYRAKYSVQSGAALLPSAGLVEEVASLPEAKEV